MAQKPPETPAAPDDWVKDSYPLQLPVPSQDCPEAARAAWEAFQKTALLGSLGDASKGFLFGDDGRLRFSLPANFTRRTLHPQQFYQRVREVLLSLGLTPEPPEYRRSTIDEAVSRQKAETRGGLTAVAATHATGANLPSQGREPGRWPEPAHARSEFGRLNEWIAEQWRSGQLLTAVQGWYSGHCEAHKPRPFRKVLVPFNRKAEIILGGIPVSLSVNLTRSGITVELTSKSKSGDLPLPAPNLVISAAGCVLSRPLSADPTVTLTAESVGVIGCQVTWDDAATSEATPSSPTPR